jgi:hypothetical protein
MELGACHECASGSNLAFHVDFCSQIHRVRIFCGGQGLEHPRQKIGLRKTQKHSPENQDCHSRKNHLSCRRLASGGPSLGAVVPELLVRSTSVGITTLPFSYQSLPSEPKIHCILYRFLARHFVHARLHQLDRKTNQPFISHVALLGEIPG